MKKIYIKTTEQCNLSCKHCYIGNNRFKAGFFNEVATIDFLKKYEQFFYGEEFFVTFHGGEPFLAPLETIKKICETFETWHFTATSNLINLNENIISFIKQYFRDENDRPFIKTSWDWKIRFSRGQELIWIQNIKALLENKIVVKVNICLTEPLIRECDPKWLVKHLKEIGIKEIHFERLSYNTTENKNLIPDYDDQDNWLKNFYILNSKEVVPLDVDNFEELRYAVNGCHIDCRKRECMSNTITINADGTIGACPNTSIKDWYMDIYDEPGKEIRNRKHESLITKENNRNIGCYYCDLFKICNGDCCQLSWINNKCPAPKKLIRKIIDDLEEEKSNIVSVQ